MLKIGQHKAKSTSSTSVDQFSKFFHWQIC